MVKIFSWMLSLVVSSALLGQARLGEIPPPVTISGAAGGLVSGYAWESTMIKGKVWSVLYVDPDHSDINDEMAAALKAENFPQEKYGSMAIINMAATWLPNMVIEAKLRSKQSEFPDTVYVKDLKKTLVKNWGLADDTYEVLVFGADGKMLFRNEGKMTKAQINQMIEIIKTVL